MYTIAEVGALPLISVYVVWNVKVVVLLAAPELVRISGVIEGFDEFS